MYLLTDGKWHSGYCNYALHRDNHVRIEVCDWHIMGRINDQYISYPLDWRIIYNYLRDVGIKAVFLKLVSRLREKNRNAKFYAIGTGKVIETGQKSNCQIGNTVIFFAPNHPECVSEVVLSDQFVFNAPEIPLGAPSNLRLFRKSTVACQEALQNYTGWSDFSGMLPDRSEIQKALEATKKDLLRLSPESACEILTKEQQKIQQNPAINKPAEFKAALFGLGNYAKVFIIPNLNRRISLWAVHEIDPAQLGRKKWAEGYVSTSPFPDESHGADIYFAAGYHHTHAAVAIHALSRGACAVVEKPVATTDQQLDEIETLLKAGKGSFFACFHKRYSILSDWAKEDLESEAGDAVDYHCIVYEIPLPIKHWYNWKTSGSRIVSNGCHWIDHFMFLNYYSPVSKSSVSQSARGHIHIQAQLENGAVFSMLLTDIGSPRLGVRDYIELRKGHTTISMTDSSIYKSENAKGPIREKRANKIDAYKRMYANISSMIVDGKGGDSIDSLRSSRLVIELDQRLSQENS